MASTLRQRMRRFCEEMLGFPEDQDAPPRHPLVEFHYTQNNMALNVYDAVRALMADTERTQAEIEHDFERIVRFYRRQKMPPTPYGYQDSPVGTTYCRTFEAAYYGNQ
jgi:hypothetical protein